MAHIGVAVRTQQFIADALTIEEEVLALLSGRRHWGNNHILTPSIIPPLLDRQHSVRASSSECFARLLICALECCPTCISGRLLDAHVALTSAIERENELCALQLLRLISLPSLPSEHIAYITLSLDKCCFGSYFRWNPPADFSSAPTDRHELSTRITEEDDGLLWALLHEAAHGSSPFC